MDLEPTTFEPDRSLVARLARKLRKSEKGQALVEFTMIMPLFVLLFCGMVDFGRAFYTWLVITNAAREGARIAAVQSDASTVNNRIYQSFCDNYPSDCTLDPTKLSITKTNVQGSRGTPVKIDLSYNFQYVTPIGSIMSFVSGGTISTPVIKAHSSMRLE